MANSAMRSPQKMIGLPTRSRMAASELAIANAVRPVARRPPAMIA